MQVSSILRCDVGVGESLSKLGVLSRGLPLSLLDMLLVIGGELKNLIFPLQFAFLDGSFVFLDVGPFILFLVFPLFGGALVYLWLARFHQIEGELHAVAFTMACIGKLDSHLALYNGGDALNPLETHQHSRKRFT